VGIHQHDELGQAAQAAGDDDEALHHESGRKGSGALAGKPEPDCKITPKGKSGDSYSWEMSCPKSGMRGSGTTRYGKGTIEGETKISSPGKGKGKGEPFEMTTKIKGRRLGPCK
jgi:hypothetical protein